MDMLIDRRTALRLGGGALAAGAACGLLSAAHARAQEEPARRRERPDPLEREAVRAFVGAAHSDLDRVRVMLDEQPTIVNAVWDWGGGDFESAIGAAAHMGRADIARELLDRGARMDLYAAAMLGELGVVKAVLGAFPGALRVGGAHGIPLLDHARKGGEAAAGVVAYLEGLGA